MFGKHAYIAAFATYVEARLDAAFDHPAAAIKGYRAALDKGFDPQRTVEQLAHVLTFRKKPEDARELLEHWIPRMYPDLTQFGYTPDGPLSVLTKQYRDVGGSETNLRDGSALPEYAARSTENRGKRATRASEFAAKGKERAAAMLDGYSRQGLTLVDGLLHSADYDVALGEEETDGNGDDVRLDASAAARLCLDETPLFKEVGLDPLGRLAERGLPAAEAATYGLALAERAEKRFSLSWQKLREACPNLFGSALYGERRTRAALGRGDLAPSQELLVHFAKEKVFEPERSLVLYEALAERHRGGGDHEAVASLGEALVGHVTGESKSTVRRRTVETLLTLAGATDAVGLQIGFLERAAEMDPNDEAVADRLSSARKARFQRNLIIVGVISGVVAIAILIANLMSGS